MSIVRVVDFETSGLKPPEAEVCEVGICDLDTVAGVLEPHSWVCGVEAMPPEVRAVHHITLAECAGRERFYRATLMHTPCAAMAAHNAAYEMQFFTPAVPMICTYKAALRVWPDAPAHNNGTLRYWLEDAGLITLDPALAQPSHRAGPDAYVTAHVLRALLRTGTTGRQMVAWTKEPPLLPRCPIGEYRGKPWSEVEAGFLGWMTRQATMDPDLKWNANREITRRAEQAEQV